MAIDFEAVRRKLNKLSGNSTRRDVQWKPQEGEEYTVRVMAFDDNDGQPFKERWFYYGIGNNPGLLTPHQFGKPDPVQNLINQLREDGTKESYELAKKLYPKMRCYAPVIVRGEEDKGVRLWAFGKTVYQSLLNIMLDEDYGDITDPLTGRDVKVVCTKANGKTYATTEIRPRGKLSPLSPEAATAREWLSSIPSIDDMFSCKSADELEKIVNDWLNPETAESDPGSERTGDSSSSSKKTVEDVVDAIEDTKSDSRAKKSGKKSDNKYQSLDDAFADLTD